MYELSPREELIEIIVNQHKSAFGVKPRGPAYERLTKMTYAELRQESEILDGAVQRAMQEAEEAEEFAVTKFKERIADNLSLGAADEATAYRWLLQAEDLADEFDEGYIEYHFGLPYGYLKGKYI